MKKKSKIKEVKGKIKIVKELSKGEGGEEIEDLTEGEIPVSEFNVSNWKGSSPSMSLVNDVPRAPTRSEEEVRQPARDDDGGDNRPLYDVGRSMGGESSERSYEPVESIGESGLRNVNVGGDFAMGSSSSFSPYPSANRVESGLREETVEKKKYASDIESSQRKKSKHGYAWEA